MKSRRLRLAFLGLSLSSSWGNGHATTYRALLRGLADLGHDILFLERDVPWYAAHRDLPEPDFCRLKLYESLDELKGRFGENIAKADAVIVGSYVPDGIEVIDFVLSRARGATAFYDIDTPVTLAKLDDESCAYLATRQISEFDLYLSFTGGPLLQRLAASFGAKRPQALYCAVDDRLYCPIAAEKRWDLGYLGTYSADRQPALERLLLEPARRLPGYRFVVAGPQYPENIEWPQNVERIQHLAPDDHALFYSRQRFTLNITRADMVAAGWSPSVRLFEAAACAVPVISDRWDGLSQIFPEDSAIVIADAGDDVVRSLTDHSVNRIALGESARAIVRKHHTGVKRAQELEALIEQGQGRRAHTNDGQTRKLIERFATKAAQLPAA